MKLTVDIMEDFINTLDLSGKVLSFSVDATNTTIVVEKTYHARKKMLINIDSTDFEVVSVVNNQSIEVGDCCPLKLYCAKSFLFPRDTDIDQYPY